MLVLLFTFLNAATLLMWRHTGCDDASLRQIVRSI